jgi:hypothetical protein
VLKNRLSVDVSLAHATWERVRVRGITFVTLITLITLVTLVTLFDATGEGKQNG